MADEEPSIGLNLFGQSVAAKGTSAIIIMVLLVFGGGMAFLLYDRTQEAERQSLRLFDEQTRTLIGQHILTQDTLRSMKEVNESISTVLNEQNYIILSDEKERQEIKRGLRRPASLSRKLNN